MQSHVTAALVLSTAGAGAVLARSALAARELGRLPQRGSVTGSSVHPADPWTLAGLECVVVALGLAAGWVWAVILGAAGAAALFRFARASRLEVTVDSAVFGTGSSAATLPLHEVGSVVRAPRSGLWRSFGTIGIADRDGAWVAVVRPGAIRHPAGAVAAIVRRSELDSVPEEHCWRRRGAAPATGRLPFLAR